MSTDAVGREYLKETNMMFIGGLMVAIGVEHSNLHRRIALKVSLSLHPPFELNLSEIVLECHHPSYAYSCSIGNILEHEFCHLGRRADVGQ